MKSLIKLKKDLTFENIGRSSGASTTVQYSSFTTLKASTTPNNPPLELLDEEASGHNALCIICDNFIALV